MDSFFVYRQLDDKTVFITQNRNTKSFTLFIEFGIISSNPMEKQPERILPQYVNKHTVLNAYMIQNFIPVISAL
jgi:hypothetical protein